MGEEGTLGSIRDRTGGGCHLTKRRACDNGRMKRRVIRHYEFVRKIGAGGSGVVFLANDTLLQRPVVLKLLKRGALTLEQVRRTQLREARLASAIDHPNVCAIYDVGEADDEGATS